MPVAGKTPAAALNAYLEPLTRAVSCITQSNLVHNCYKPGDGEERFLVLAHGDPVRVPVAAGGHLRIGIEQRFKVVETREPDRGPWKVSTLKYEYSICHDDGREILAYHWHPGEQAHDQPHIHICSGAGTLIPQVQSAYLPTGRIAVEAFVLMAIREFGVQHRRGEDYKRVLDASLAKFEAHKSW